MGKLMLERVIATLKAAGFRTQRAYPAQSMPAITGVVAAACLDSVDYTMEATTVKVEILCPVSLGAAVCEDAAIEAGAAMQAAGMFCRVEGITFNGKTGLFSVAVLASTAKLADQLGNMPFKIGAVVQNYVVTFTAERQVSKDASQVEDAPWTVRLEQFFPFGAKEDTDPSGNMFTLTNGSEVYHGCCWASQKRVTEAAGTRQIREGTAMSRTVL